MRAPRRLVCTVLLLALCMNFMPRAVFAAETIPTDPAEITSPTETTEITEPTQITEATDATDPTEVTEPAEATGPMEVTEPVEVTDPTEATDPTEVTDPTEATEPTDQTEPEDALEEPPKGWGLYFGQLHSHSGISDGLGTVEEAFSYAAQVPGLDFLAVTDHSESISGSDSASLSQDMTALSADWAMGKAAALAATSRDFVGIYGYEMSWPGDKEIGHINTLNTPGFVSWQQEEFSHFRTGLENYCAALGTVPGSVSQFNHPGTQYGDFKGFTQYSAAVDHVVQLLEVGSGEDAYLYYTRALDYGWHVAPTCSQNNHSGSWGSMDTGRTVVVANSLTEAGIYDALRNHRVYATRDSDLHIYFDSMGSRLARRNVGETLTLNVKLHDPTDVVGTVEVIVHGGEVLAAQAVDANSGELSFAVPGDYSYYYLRVTQPDGDTAVTAPIWLEGEAGVEISGFVCNTNVPIQGQPVDLALTISNQDTADLLVEKIDFSIGGVVFHRTTDIPAVPAGGTAEYTCSPVLNRLGVTEITVTVTGTLEGNAETCEKNLTISLRKDDMVNDILVDTAHGNAGVDQLTKLELLAADNRVSMTVAAVPITEEMLADAGILLIQAPTAAFSEEFVETAGEFVKYGGTLILCGRSDSQDGDVHTAAELNRILSAAGATMTFRDDEAQDAVHNGGENTDLFPAIINRDAPWCAGVSENQVYRHTRGCTIDPGSGTWLVKGHDTTGSADTDGDGLSTTGAAPVLLAWEKTAGGGRIFAAGSLFLLEEELAEPKSIWDEPYANRTILGTILGAAQVELPLNTIESVRTGEKGRVCRIRGYVTAGTAKEGNRFPDRLYLQDDTGGIGVAPFAQEGISVGTPMEVTGYLDAEGKNKVFRVISFQVLDSAAYRYLGLTGQYREVMDNSLHGGRLVQVEGIVERIQLTEEGILSQIILRDEHKNYATVLVESDIFSGSTGKNELAEEIQEGEEIRALGILHMHTDGTSVVRVRNCDEVVVIDPWPYTPDKVYKVRDRTNPHTGDGIGLYLGTLLLSAALLKKVKKRSCKR